MMNSNTASFLAGAVVLALGVQTAFADDNYLADSGCAALAKAASYKGASGYSALRQALVDTVDVGGSGNLGLGNNMWLTVVSNDGTVCAVTKTGATGKGAAGTDAWLLSRIISAQKANTANGLSSNGGVFSTGMLYNAVQGGVGLDSGLTTNPAANGGSLFGLQHSNPVDAQVAYKGNSSAFGTILDPLVGKRPGGVNVFGGGVPVYDAAGVKLGAFGVSGDTSCTDHIVVWKVRAALSLDHTPASDALNTGATTPANQTHPLCGETSANLVSKGGGGWVDTP